MEIEGVVELNDQNGAPLIDKYSLNSLVSILDRTLLQGIENIYRLKEEGLDLVQFSRFFMNCIEHKQNHSPFLAAGLTELFESISNGGGKVKFGDITDFICDHILQQQTANKQLETRWVPIRGHSSEKLHYLRDPPILKGGKMQQICKVWMGKSLSDKGKHDNVISHAYYSEFSRKIYCLQGLADWIGIYSSDAKLQQKIRPSAFKVKKDAAVLSIYYSERQERLGAILKDFSISFWDSSDNHSFQKSINTAKYCQQLQSSIWYLQYFQKWMTADLTGGIYFWNLLEQKPQRKMSCKNKSRITDICEVPSVGVLAIAQQQKGVHTESTKIQLLDITRGQVVAEIDTKIQRRMLHTIKYSQEYQVLLSAGYQKKISLFQINTRYLDSSQRGELLGHQSAVTCFTLVRKTPMVVSADDRGKVKIWNIRNFKCMQTLDFSDKVVITKLLDMGVDRKIAVMGSRISLLYLQQSPATMPQITPLKAKATSNCLFIFTQMDMRSYDFKTGKLIKIDCHFNTPNAEVTTMSVFNKGEVVSGNQKGQICFYCKNTGKLTQTSSWHSGTVQYLEEDVVNGLMVSFSDHSGFIVSRRMNQTWEEIRLLKGNFVGKDLLSICFSSYHSILVFISQRSVFLCDYQLFKIEQEITFQSQDPTTVAIINGLGLILIGTTQGKIHVFEIKQEMTVSLLTIDCKKFLPITQLLADLKCRQFGIALQVQSCYISCGFGDGSIQTIDFLEESQQLKIKVSKSSNFIYNPYRQIRQNFEQQVKKCKYQICKHQQSPRTFQGIIYNLQGHSGGLTSLSIAQFDEHLLISTGNDNRIKVWCRQSLIGDLNVNLPLPYKWSVEISSSKNIAKKVLQGLELIQIIFRRFGKDISIGQSQAFKINVEKQRNTHQRSSTDLGKKLKKRATLFQDEFSTVDLNYEKIKRGRLMPVGGSSLKRMQLSKKVENLQKQWQIAKFRQQEDRGKLLKTLQLKAQKHQQKQTIVAMLRDRSNFPVHHQEPLQLSPVLKNLEVRLQTCLERQRRDDSMLHTSYIPKNGKQINPMKVIGKNKVQKIGANKKTLQNYFIQKYHVNPSLSGLLSSQKNSPRNSIESCEMENELRHKKEGTFRIMLKQMRQKLCKSKKTDTLLLDSKGETIRMIRKSSGHVLRQSSLILSQLDKQIGNFINDSQHRE